MPKKNIFSESLIFQKLKYKDKQAFGELYDHYVDDIYRFIFFRVNSTEDAEDLTSAVFLKTWNYFLENFHSEYNSLKPLIFKIARNAVIDHYRQARVKNNQPLEQIRPEELLDEQQDLDRKIDEGFQSDQIVKKISLLKEEFREILILKYINDFSVKEISAIIDKPPGTVRVQIFRALKALKEIMPN